MRLSKKNIFLFVFLCLLYFLTRLINLTKFPIFCDEAIYIRWAQIMRSEPSLRFLPLSDGKQPLFMWLIMPLLKFIPDPLFAGRLLSVLSGLISLIGVFVLALIIFNSTQPAFFSVLVYIFLPYVFFFDKMALVDTLLMGLGIWTMIFGILLVKHKKMDFAIFCGIVLGAALITKSPALFFVFLLPFTLLIVPYSEFKKGRFFKTLLKIVPLWLVTYTFAFMIYNILRLGPNFQMISIRNKDYIFSLAEVLKHPSNPLVHHLKDIFLWFPNLFTYPLFLLIFLGVYLGFKKEKRSTLLLLSWAILPLLSQSFLAKVFNSRYLLFSIFPLIVFIGLSLEKVTKLTKNKMIKILIIVLFFLIAARYDFLLSFFPYKAPLTQEMKRGYLLDWTSGVGINEIRDFLKKEAEKEKIIVGTEGYFGTLPDGLLIYFDKNPNVTIIGVGIDIKEIPPPLLESSQKTPTYLVINQSRLKLEKTSQMELILKIPKGEISQQTDYLLLYKIKPL